jgi:hypothetical protein
VNDSELSESRIAGGKSNSKLPERNYYRSNELIILLLADNIIDTLLC